jgi:hypothetical protein
MIDPAIFISPVSKHEIIKVSVDARTRQEMVFKSDLARVSSGLCRLRLKNLSINIALPFG